MNTLTNRSMILSSRPVGFPKESDFQLLESACPTPREKELLIKTGRRQSVGDIKIYTGGSLETVAHVVSIYLFVDSAGCVPTVTCPLILRIHTSNLFKFHS